MSAGEFHPSQRWPRIRDLPAHEQEPFTKWLEGQAQPLIIEADGSITRGYFGHDYDRWKRHLHADAGVLKEWLHKRHA